MYQCFHCGTMGVIWDGDFDFSDYGLDDDGIIHECHCTNCGARITYQCPNQQEEEKEFEEEIEGQTNIFDFTE